MSLSGTLSNALSGLAAASRGAQVVSSNVSNALTEGYGRRVLETSAASLVGKGTGVKVEGVRREVNQGLIDDRRRAEAETGGAQTRADALDRLEAAFGTPGEGDAIADRIAALESALVAAASRPDSEARLSAVLTAAQGLAGAISDASDDIQALRQEADSAIARDVATLNDTLAEIADLNGQIRVYSGSGLDSNALIDQRQALIDGIAEIVPLRELQRDDGMIALYTPTGAALLDGQPAEFGFAAVGVIVPEMSAESGALSGLTLNGQPVQVTGPHAAMGGGRLEALFEQRDSLAPAAQADLDALAADLIARFSAPGPDPSLPDGAAGLFLDTDTGASETGLAGRIAFNPAADPGSGGALWRLRSGLAAAAPGAVGDATLLNAYADALSAARLQTGGPFTGRALSASDLAAETVSRLSVAAESGAEEAGFAAARGTALREAELAGGVDTDAELQNLLLYERAYAANAKVIQAVDQMIQTLIGL